MPRSKINAKQQVANGSVTEDLLSAALLEKLNLSFKIQNGVLIGAIDGVNKVFDVEGTYIENGLTILDNGQKIAEGGDYTIDSQNPQQITLTIAPELTDSMTYTRIESVGRLSQGNEFSSSSIIYNQDATIQRIDAVLDNTAHVTTFTYNPDGTVASTDVAYLGETKTETFIYTNGLLTGSSLI